MPDHARASRYSNSFRSTTTTHRAITGVVRMEVVSDIVVAANAGRTVGIAHRGVEIDHAVEIAAATNPFVDRFALRLSRRLVVAVENRTLVWRKGQTVDFRPAVK